MKTLHLSIIAGTGIGLVVIMTFLLFFMTPNEINQQNSEILSPHENSSDVKIIVNGINDTYLLGQRIDFNLTTISKECSQPHLILTDENGSVVWTSKQDMMFCDVISASWQPTPWHWRLDSGGLGSPQVNQAGIYKITIGFFGKTIEKEFSVVLTDSSKTNSLSEKDCGQFYPVPSDNHYHFNETYPVLILKQNSIGCAKLTYTINYKYNDSRSSSPWSQMAIIGERFHIGNYIYTSNGNSYGVSSRDTTNLFETASIPNVIDLSKYPVGSQFTVTYVIKPLLNATGFYDYSVEEVPCVTYPLVVGFSAEQVNSSDFSKGMVGMHDHSCINAPYAISSVQISDMDFTKIKFQ